MQDRFAEVIPFLGDYRVVRELGTRGTGRIADFLLFDGVRLINVEAKCQDFTTLLDQLADHALYCDYCFALIPDYSFTPEWFKQKLLSSKYGLLVYNYRQKVVTEVLEAHSNRPPDKATRRRVIDEIKRRTAVPDSVQGDLFHLK